MTYSNENIVSPQVDYHKVIDYSMKFDKSMFDLLMDTSDECINDWLEACDERIKEEMRMRIETGDVVPLKYLKWYDFARIPWKSEVPFY